MPEAAVVSLVLRYNEDYFDQGFECCDHAFPKSYGAGELTMEIQSQDTEVQESLGCIAESCDNTFDGKSVEPYKCPIVETTSAISEKPSIIYIPKPLENISEQNNCSVKCGKRKSLSRAFRKIIPKLSQRRIDPTCKSNCEVIKEDEEDAGTHSTVVSSNASNDDFSSVKVKPVDATGIFREKTSVEDLTSILPRLVRVHSDFDCGYLASDDTVHERKTQRSGIECTLPEILSAKRRPEKRPFIKPSVQIKDSCASGYHGSVDTSRKPNECLNSTRPTVLCADDKLAPKVATPKQRSKYYEIPVPIARDDPWLAAKKGDLKALKRMAKENPSLDWTKEDEFQSTPLYYACHSGAVASKDGLEAVRFLLEKWPGQSVPEKVLDRCKKNAINSHVLYLLDSADKSFKHSTKKKKKSPKSSSKKNVSPKLMKKKSSILDDSDSEDLGVMSDLFSEDETGDY